MDPADDTGGDGTRQPPLATVAAGGARLRYLRCRRRWKQSQLARRFQEVGAWYRGAPALVSSLVTMISRWENGTNIPDSYNLHILAEALDVQVETLGFPIDPDYVHPPRRRTPLPFV
jgi:transcriptional regulator with XRE-family HTH domain